MACASIFYDDRKKANSRVGINELTVISKSSVDTNELTYLYNIIIKQQPEVVAFHNGDVVTPVWTTEKKLHSVLLLQTQLETQSPRSHLHLHELTHTDISIYFASLESFTGQCGRVNTASLTLLLLLVNLFEWEKLHPEHLFLSMKFGKFI